MTHQAALFAEDGSPVPPRRFRRRDPKSSRLAAEELERTGAADSQCTRVLAAVMAHPNCTTQELHALTGISVHVLGRRLPELRKRLHVTNPPIPPPLGDGTSLMRRCAIGNRSALTWRAVPRA